MSKRRVKEIDTEGRKVVFHWSDASRSHLLMIDRGEARLAAAEITEMLNAERLYVADSVAELAGEVVKHTPKEEAAAKDSAPAKNEDSAPDAKKISDPPPWFEDRLRDARIADVLGVTTTQLDALQPDSVWRSDGSTYVLVLDIVAQDNLGLTVEQARERPPQVRIGTPHGVTLLMGVKDFFKTYPNHHPAPGPLRALIKKRLLTEEEKSGILEPTEARPADDDDSHAPNVFELSSARLALWWSRRSMGRQGPADERDQARLEGEEIKARSGRSARALGDAIRKRNEFTVETVDGRCPGSYVGADWHEDAVDVTRTKKQKMLRFCRVCKVSGTLIQSPRGEWIFPEHRDRNISYGSGDRHLALVGQLVSHPQLGPGEVMETGEIRFGAPPLYEVIDGKAMFRGARVYQDDDPFRYPGGALRPRCVWCRRALSEKTDADRPGQYCDTTKGKSQRHRFVGPDGKVVKTDKTTTYAIPGFGTFEVEETPADRAAYMEKVDLGKEREKMEGKQSSRDEEEEQSKEKDPPPF